MSAVPWGCFFVSGAAALALEMLWMRSAALVFGATATTTASVLACCFAGMALGSAAARHGSARPVRRYGRLEVGVAVGAAWSAVAFTLLGGEWAARTALALGPLGAFGAIAVATLPAAVCLGATLPSLGQALAGGLAGRRGGLLYAVNTLGAATGATLTGFGLPVLVGVRASYAIAMVASAAAGSLALATERSTAVAVAATARAESPPPLRLIVVALATGALGIGLEVVWTRVLAQVLHNSTYSFAAVAIVFLVAIAAGAALAAVGMRRVSPDRLAALALVAAGVTTVAGYWTFVWLTDGLAYVGMETGLVEYLCRIAVLVALAAGPAALAASAVLPALWQAAGGSAARALGALASASSAGGAAGALLAGFVGVPTLGLRGALLFAAVTYVVLADVVLARRTRAHPFVYVALLAIVVWNPLRAPLTHVRDHETVRATLEGPSGIVTVVDDGDDTQMRLDSFYTLGGSASAVNERRQGLLPLLLHPAPARVAFVGLATGITASAAPALGVRDTTVVELVPEVAVAARVAFRQWNGGFLDRNDVHLVVDDGRRFLTTTDAHFDVIVSDLFVPWHAGAGSLYARETYEAAARRLAPGGLFCQWLPLYQLTRDEFDVIARTFLDVFPSVSLWRGDFYAERPVVALVGLRTPRVLDLDALPARIASLPEAFRDETIGSPRALAMLYAGDLGNAADLFTHAPANTDDRPVIEFLAPRLTRISTAGDKDWFTGEALGAFYETLAERPQQPTALLPATEDATSARRAGLALFQYVLATTRHDAQAAGAHQSMVRALVPDVIAQAEAGSAPASDAATARLRVEESVLRRRMSDMERRLSDLTGEHR